MLNMSPLGKTGTDIIETVKYLSQHSSQFPTVHGPVGRHFVTQKPSLLSRLRVSVGLKYLDQSTVE